MTRRMRRVGSLRDPDPPSSLRSIGMKTLLSTLAIAFALVAPASARAESLVSGAESAAEARKHALSTEESARLARGETVIREQTLERGDHRYVGGITYTVVDASSAEVAAIFDNVELLRRVLPRTKRARVVGSSGGDQLLELAQGNAVMEAEYTVRLRRGRNQVRFWLDPSRPHGIDDAWGFFRYEPFIGASGEERVLLTYGVLVDVGPGIVRELFEERLRTALMSVPQLVRRQVAEVRRF